MDFRCHPIIILNGSFVAIPTLTSILLIRQPERMKIVHKSNQVNNYISLSKPTCHWIHIRTRIGQHRVRVHQRKILLAEKGRGPKIGIIKMIKVHYPNQTNQNGQTHTFNITLKYTSNSCYSTANTVDDSSTANSKNQINHCPKS